MEELIQHMITCGWRLCLTGGIVGPQDQRFSTWTDAIKACIEVASEA